MAINITATINRGTINISANNVQTIDVTELTSATALVDRTFSNPFSNGLTTVAAYIKDASGVMLDEGQVKRTVNVDGSVILQTGIGLDWNNLTIICIGA